MLKLYDHPLSGNSYKSRLALNQLGIEYERINVDIFKGVTLAVKNIINDYFHNIHEQNLTEPFACWVVLMMQRKLKLPEVANG